MYSIRNGLIGSSTAFVCISAFLVMLLAGTALAKLPKRQVSYASTAWSLTGKVKGSIKGLGKLKDIANVQLFFGPLDLFNEADELVLSLAEGEFLVNDVESARFVTGSFVDNGKGKAILVLDIDELKEFLAETFEDAFAAVDLDIDGLAILRLSASTKAKARDIGDTIKLKLKTKFFATGSAAGEAGEAKGSFSISAAGLGVAVEE